MKVTLIKAPWLSTSPAPALGQPLGMASIAAQLRREGHQVGLIDPLLVDRTRQEALNVQGRAANRHGPSDQAIADLVPLETNIIGVSTSFTHDYHTAGPLLRSLRKAHPRATLVLGGVLPSTLPAQCAELECDYICIGEGEPVMSALASGNPVAPGLHRSKEVRTALDVKALSRSTVEDLDALALPARDLMPFEAYLASGASGRGKSQFGASIHTSRGCPFNCSFCSVHSVFKRGFRKRSAEHVWEEMKEIVERWGVRRFEFEDDNLTLDRERAIAIFERMAAWNAQGRPPLSFVTPNGIRIDTLDASLVDLMRRAGCDRVSLAAEHGDPDMLKAMNKKLDPDRIVQAVRLFRRAGIAMAVYFVIGFPGETPKRFQRGVDFMRRLKQIDPRLYVSVHPAKALPETDLLRLCRSEGYPVSPEPELMFLEGEFSNITTPDFDPQEVDRRFHQANRALNTPSLARRAAGRIMRAFRAGTGGAA